MAESASAKIQQEANASIKNEDECPSSVIDITKLVIDNVQPCIYKVPDPLRKLNEEVYTPQVISIGPFHHGRKKLETMEKYKERYLEAFSKRVEINMGDLKMTLKNFEVSVRQCYAGTFIGLSSDDFVTMILTDASFIIELFFRNWLAEWTSEDRIVLKPLLAARMQLDLILLENQLPFFIIVKLFDLAFASRPGFPSLEVLTFAYFDSYNKQKMSPHPELKILHFLDLLRNFYLPRRLQNRNIKIVELMYSAAQLDGVGFKFEVDYSSNCLLDLELDYKKRVLKIPPFTLDNDTELYVQNLWAFEQCHYPNSAYVTDYFILLKFLINSEEDVALLRRKEILVSGFGNKHAIDFIDTLGKSIIYSTMSSNYNDICSQLKKFYENPWHRWMVSLRQDYFGSPWMAASTTAASVLLILTAVQTVFSIPALSHH